MLHQATPEQEHSSLQTSNLNLANLFAFRHFQKDDMARAALMNGALLGWEPGLGKTMPAFAMPWLWQSRHTLIVVQADLHEQLIKEGRDKFGVNVRVIDSQETALQMMRQGILPFPGSSPENLKLEPSNSQAMPEFFITAYNWLGFNGGDEWEADKASESIRSRRLMAAARLLNLPANDRTLITVTSGKFKPNSRTAAHEVLGITKDATPQEIKTAYRTAAKLYHPDLHPNDDKAASYFVLINAAYEKLTGKDTRNYDVRLAELTKEDPTITRFISDMKLIEEGIGQTRTYEVESKSDSSLESSVSKSSFSIKCVFKPTLASIVHSTFDCVVCDEAVAIKSGTAMQAEGLLRMNPKYRLALTGTPIKNKLPDLFFIASWVTGFNPEPTARFPYGNTTGDRANFTTDFSVIEENLTKREKDLRDGNSKRSYTKSDPTQLCNIHRLWRLLGPVIIRRRKDSLPDCDIVPKIIIPLRVMPGTEQKKVYRFHVNCPPPHESPLASIGAQLMCLRQAALHPANPQLTRLGRESDSVSSSIFTPKIAAILKLATDLMEKGEQLVIFSPFTEFSSDLSNILTRSAIPHLCLDGRTSPTKRGQMLAKFKHRQIPILIAGIKGMASGHDLNCCSNLVLPGIEWALDLNRQAVDRIHRLTSKKAVNIYVVITEKTIDERLAAVWQEKGDASDLALDGRLITDTHEKIDAAQFLRDAVADFDPTCPTLCEKEVEEKWNITGAAAIQAAYQQYRNTATITHDQPQTTNTVNPVNTVKKSPSLPTPPLKLNTSKLETPTRTLPIMRRPKPTPQTENIIIQFPTPTPPQPRVLPIKKKAATMPQLLK